MIFFLLRFASCNVRVGVTFAKITGQYFTRITTNDHKKKHLQIANVVFQNVTTVIVATLAFSWLKNVSHAPLVTCWFTGNSCLVFFCLGFNSFVYFWSTFWSRAASEEPMWRAGRQRSWQRFQSVGKSKAMIRAAPARTRFCLFSRPGESKKWSGFQ